MNVLLTGKYSVIEPLGLMFLESSLREIGEEVKIILFGVNSTSERIPQDFDLVGFSAYTGYHKTIFRISDYVRQRGKVKTVIGGAHASFFARDCLEHADYVVVGEGLESLKKICTKDVNKGIVFTPNLVSGLDIPSPYRKTLYTTYDSFRVNPIKNVMCSFGCPFNCNYCYNDSYNHLYGDRIVRYRSPDAVVEECKELKDYPLELIFFQDDCFGFKLSWLEEFSRKYKRDVGIPFHCQIRPETVTMSKLKLLKEAGCHGVTMAIESFNEKVRREILGRNGSNKDIFRACELVKKYGLKLRTEQMLGVPNTTFEDELNLLKMNVKIKPNIAWTSIYTPYLGTKLGDDCKANGLYDGNNDDLNDSFFFDTMLKFDSERVQKINQLQKIFSTCSHIVAGDELARSFLEDKTHDFIRWFSLMRKHLYDNDLYKVERE